MSVQIVQIKPKFEKAVQSLFRAVVKFMNEGGLFQWDKKYPQPAALNQDILNGEMYGILEGEKVVATITLNTNQDEPYESLPWEITEGTQLVVHRLAVHPKHLGNKFGNHLMAFAEDLAREQDHTAIRLDTFSGNPHALKLYDNLGYKRVGIINLDYREGDFVVFEKGV
jgi:ribosomal protein S18 acetylase RimI-like enzyme